MLEIRPLALDGVVELRPRQLSDERGFFSETWNETAFAAVGIDLHFVQDNHSLSREVGVLRGLHFQAPPFAQDKLVMCLRGEVWDVAIDLRSGSPTFLSWHAERLSADNGIGLLIPKGFAHGFLALEPDSEVQYKVTAPYNRDHDRAIRFDDPAIGVEWPIEREALILSDKDRAAPLLADIDTGF